MPGANCHIVHLNIEVTMKLTDMSLDDLYKEEKKLNETFFAPKILYPTLVIMLLSIFLAIYTMKDGFSYTLSIVIFLGVYYSVRKFIYRSQIRKEIKARRSS